jgi:transglutaminase-like putative cysteine protease
MPFQPESNNLDDYLTSTSVVDWDNPAVSNKAREIAGGKSSDIEIAKALFEWVRDQIPHSRDANREEVTCSASEVLTTGTGICYAKSHLLAAMLRANGIPAGFCYQVYRGDESDNSERLLLHGLNGIYLASVGRWVRVDCRGNTSAADSPAEFDLDDEKLAFPSLAFMDDVIYANPLLQVVHALQSCATRTELWRCLPSPTEKRLAAV